MEIIIWDDASVADFSFLNERENITFYRSSLNLGRARTRNLLAEKAVFPYLLFLDADVFPVYSLFLEKYAQLASPDTILVGGIRYEDKAPGTNQFFRWFYGKAREEMSVEKRRKDPYLHFMTGNFFIPKALFFVFPLFISTINTGTKIPYSALHFSRKIYLSGILTIRFIIWV